MKMRDRINKQAKDMVDMALEWMILSKHIKVDKDGIDSFRLFDEMQTEVLNTYTDIQEKIDVEEA
jgi:hypothetical protein